MEFTKDMLRTGMRIVLKDGSVGIVIKDIGYIIYDGEFDLISNYKENLCNVGMPKLDIAYVYNGLLGCNTLNFNELGQLIWERKEETEQQKQIRELQETIKKTEEQIKNLQKLS